MTTPTTNNSRFANLDFDMDVQADTFAPLPAPVPAPVPLEIEGTDHGTFNNVSGAPQYGPAHKALAAKDLAFEVALVEPALYTPDGRKCVNSTEFLACMNLTSGRNYGYVGRNYGFVQPHELAAVVDAASPKGSEITVRSDSTGKTLVFTVALPKTTFDVSPDTQAVADAMHQYGRNHWENGKTPIYGELYFKHVYGGGGGYKVGLLLKALVCDNGMRVPLKEGGKALNIRHSAKFADRVDNLKHAFEVAGGAMAAYNGLFADLAHSMISIGQFDKYAKHLFAGDKTGAKNKRDRLTQIYYNAPGAAPGTAWGAVQAGTYYATHEINVRTGGRSASRHGGRYTLDMPDSVQDQARAEGMIYGGAGSLTEKALQYVTTNMLSHN